MTSRLALSAGTLTVMLILWWLVTSFGLISPVSLPGPLAVAEQAVVLVQTGFLDATLAEHTGASLARMALALAAALVTAIPVGLAIGLSRIARGIFDPLIEFYRPIPPLAYLPLIVIWLGIGEVAKIVLIYLAMFAPIALSTAAGVANVAPERVNAARSLGATRLQWVRFVVLPSALPEIVIGIRLGLGAGWSTLVAAELVAATKGLGFMVQSASQFLATDTVIVGILVIAAIAFALELGIRLVERYLIPWRGKA